MKPSIYVFVALTMLISFAKASEQYNPYEGNDTPYVCADEYCTTKEPSKSETSDYCETGRGCSSVTEQPAITKPKHKKKVKPHYYCNHDDKNDCIVVYK